MRKKSELQARVLCGLVHTGPKSEQPRLAVSSVVPRGVSHEREGIVPLEKSLTVIDRWVKRGKPFGPSVDGEKHLVKIKPIQDFLAA